MKELDAFPLLQSGDGSYSREQLFHFENKLRDTVEELIKPVYGKITDTLTSMRKVQGKQDEADMNSKETNNKIEFLTKEIHRIDDLKSRVDSMTELVNNVQSATQRRMGTVMDGFASLTSQFERSEEYSRIARKASDNL